MTSNYKELEKIVKKKFGSMQNFSKLLHNDRRTLQSIGFLADKEENYWKVYNLIKAAKRMIMENSKIYISESERKEIIKKVDAIIQSRKADDSGYKKSKFLQESGISKTQLHVIVSGDNVYKNDAYDRLMDFIVRFNAL